MPWSSAPFRKHSLSITAPDGASHRKGARRVQRDWCVAAKGMA